MARHGNLMDLTGYRFGRLTVLERGKDYVSPAGHRRVRWVCACDCGDVRLVYAQHLMRGTSAGCGTWCPANSAVAGVRTSA